MRISIPLVCQCLCMSVFLGSSVSWNPYSVLRIDSQADILTIKRAYKQLAKEWHPDKNPSPNAEEKFVEINKAYELLSDPDRRGRYDRTGVTEDTPNFSHERRDPFAAFEQFTTSGGQFRFQFQRHGTMLFHSQTVTLRQYQNHLVPDSHARPTLLLAFSEWCFRCVQVEPLWQTLTGQLESVGVGVATVHAERERELARRLGVDSLPAVFLLVDGRPVRYAKQSFSLPAVTEFIRTRLGSELLPRITVHTLPTFLSGWTDNRVRLLIYSGRGEPRLRYATLAFKFRRSVAAGFVYTEAAGSAPLLAAYNVSRRADTLLVLREAARRPAARLAAAEAPTFDAMSQLLQRNQYLALPRLSSQHVLEALCPAEASVARRRICAVLVCSSGDTRPHLQASLRQFLERSPLTDARLRYAYIYMDKQAAFMEPLIKEPAPAEPLGHLLLLWRRSDVRLQYEWSRRRWDVSPEAANRTGSRLEQRLRELLHSQRQLEHEAGVQELADEHAPHLLRRILSRLYRLWETVLDKLHGDEVVPALSVLGTIVFLILGGYLMAYLVRVEEETIQSRYRAEGRRPPTRAADAPQLRVHEMRVETYNGLVRLLKPGCRTIVLLLDAESRAGLSARFHRIVWPYRKNKSLMFAFLHLERGLEWYRQLLIPSLPEHKELNINPKNCIGTVLSINGYRKYFCMYHAKHAEAGGGGGAGGSGAAAGRGGATGGVRRRCTAARGATGGDFLGFDSSDSNSDMEAGDKKTAASRCRL